MITKENGDVPPRVWKPDMESGGQFTRINRHHHLACRSIEIDCKQRRINQLGARLLSWLSGLCSAEKGLAVLSAVPDFVAANSALGDQIRDAVKSEAKTTAGALVQQAFALGASVCRVR